MATFYAFSPYAFGVETFEQGGTGVTQRRGGWLPWWMRREHFEMLLEEERRLARLAAQERGVQARVVTEAEVLFDSLTQPVAAPRAKAAKPRQTRPEPAVDPLITKLTGPFQHLLNAPPAPRATAADLSQEDILSAIEAVEAIERHLEMA